MRRILALFLALILLTGCTTTPAETTVPTEATTAPTEPTTEPTTAPTEDPADSIRTGYYLLTGYSSEELEIDGIAMASFRGYLEILPDRTGILSMNGVIEHVEWTQRYLTVDGETCKFTIEDDVMTLNYKYEWEGTFTYCADGLPDYYRNADLEPGLYLLTDLTIEGEEYYVREPGMTAGYFLLREDHTGVYAMGGPETEFTWTNNAILIESHPQTYAFFSADQTEDGYATLVIYDMYLDYELMIFRAIDTDSSDDI